MRKRGGGSAIISLVLGIIGLAAWFVPPIGLPITLLGMLLGVQGLKSHRRRVALAGTILAGIGLLASAVNAIMGAFLMI